MGKSAVRLIALIISLFLLPVWGEEPLLTVLDDHHAQPAQMVGGQYQTRYPMQPLRGGFFQWLLTHWWREWDPPHSTPPQPVTPHLSWIHHPGVEPQVTWIGHSTVLLQIAGINLLFDPIFSKYASPWPPLGPKRYQPPGLSLSQLPHIDIVMISHNHYDHLDLPSLQALAQQSGGPPLFLVPLGDQHLLADSLTWPGGQSAPYLREFNWDQHLVWPTREGPMSLHFDAVQHWSTRDLADKNTSLWGSWAVLAPHFRFWFSGDLGYSPDTQDIGRKYGHFDLAAIAIGAYHPEWYLKTFHINPEQAVDVMTDVHAKQAFGIHWGTFPLSDEAPDQPPKRLVEALKAHHSPLSQFVVLPLGETIRYPLSLSETHANNP
ncbi:MAG: MBL fold metallo-hydrolase [Betaproteobacteria bacterium]|jgi:Predicted Zn-dependent hydrolases of the beta-lactamase fold|nr:MBL fold metallo-hydrolase [Betaproteobacteria bacterium]